MARQTATPTRPTPERDIAYRALARRDDALARLIARHGQPDPFHWDVLDDRVDGDSFSELALHVISQQLSTTAALAIYDRVQTLLAGRVEPRTMIAAAIDDLRAAGLSGAKARSLQDLAGRIVDGRLDLESLATVDDATVATELQAVLGIGPWSAQMFLLYHYRRPDIMPSADAAYCVPRSRRSCSLKDRPPNGSRHERNPGAHFALTLQPSYGPMIETDQPHSRGETSSPIPPPHFVAPERFVVHRHSLPSRTSHRRS